MSAEYYIVMRDFVIACNLDGTSHLSENTYKIKLIIIYVNEKLIFVSIYKNEVYRNCKRTFLHRNVFVVDLCDYEASDKNSTV